MAMKLQGLLKSEKAAWAVGAAVVAGLCLAAFSAFQWLGLGLVGIGGLIATNRADLFSDAVPLYARQQDARASPEQKLAAQAKAAKRSATLYLINTFFIVIAALGVGLFLIYQLP